MMRTRMLSRLILRPLFVLLIHIRPCNMWMASYCKNPPLNKDLMNGIRLKNALYVTFNNISVILTDGSPNGICTPFGEQYALGTLSRNKGGNTVNMNDIVAEHCCTHNVSFMKCGVPISWIPNQALWKKPTFVKGNKIINILMEMFI